MLEFSAPLRKISEKITDGARISTEEAVELLRCPNLVELSALADLVRWRKHPEQVVTYVCGRNINYTNVCWVQCKFCNFFERPGSEKGYVLSNEQVFEKIEQLVQMGGSELLLQGGLNSQLKLAYFEELFAAIKQRFPTTHLHALSVAEVSYIAHMARLSVRETLERLMQAGMDTLPGAGGEILVDRVRSIIAPRKDTADEWISVMHDAHSLGMRTSATMMYGSVETLEERVEHLDRVRKLQDETGGFTAFIPWNYQPDGTELGGTRATPYEYLQIVAVSRIFLDNISSIQASWVTQGPKVAGISLSYGVNDFGSTMLEENVVSAAGTCYNLPVAEIERIITDAGFAPRRRDTLYRPVNQMVEGSTAVC